jgi:hypothetical protein
MEVTKDGQAWQLGTAGDVEWLAGHTGWLAGHTGHGDSITVAIPPVFDAYATFYQPDGVEAGAHEHAVVEELIDHTPHQPWWLGYLDTGAHDIVFPLAPRVMLYWDWPYVLIEAGPDQALSWRRGHMRSSTGSLPDLFFPGDRSWLVSALWDDTWTCIGATDELVDSLQHNALANARRVQPDQDAVPPGLTRD